MWKGHVLASILCLQCVKWVEKGKRVENVTGWHWYLIKNLLALIPHVFVLIGVCVCGSCSVSLSLCFAAAVPLCSYLCGLRFV